MDAQRRQHYELEKKLAARIRSSSPADRSRIVAECYDEMYSTITWHPTLRPSSEKIAKLVQGCLLSFDRLVPDSGDVLEIGCGTGDVAMALAAHHPHTKIVATDVSTIILAGALGNANLTFKSLEGTTLPFADASFDLVYHSQLLDHLHPDDVPTHFDEVFRVLRPGGLFAFDTPNGVTGPYDISDGFDPVATGFHLREWTYADIAGMCSVRCDIEAAWTDLPALGVLGRGLNWSALMIRCPLSPKVFLERILARFPGHRLRRGLGRALGVNGLHVVIRKSR